jgi:hypothetical protein
VAKILAAPANTQANVVARDLLNPSGAHSEHA